MIKLVNVSKFYSSNNVIALGLRKVNLELHRNEFIAIVGESGSGKTTLLNVISGIDSYEDGEMYINGNETSYYSVADMENYRKKYVAFVFQNYNLIDSYTVLQNVEAPLILSGFPKAKIRERAKEIIKRVGLEDHIHHKATKLSGGQKQRVVIARALAKDCPIIAADEPTGNLDSKSARQIIELLAEISKEKLVVLVTHDFSQVEEFATRKIRIFDGEVVEDLKLKKVDKLDLPEIPDEEHKIRTIDFMKISLRNLLAVPKKTILMIIIFTFFSIFIAMSYGAYQLALSEVQFNTNSHFNNTSPNRLVVRRMDETPLSLDDLNELETINNNVNQVIEKDYVLDSNISLYTTESNKYVYLRGLYLPVNLIEEDDLDYGRLPQNDDEIVIAVNSSELNSNEDYLNKAFSTSYDDREFFSIGEIHNIVGMINVDKLAITNEDYDDTFILVTDDKMNKLKEELYFDYTYLSMISLIEIDGTNVNYSFVHLGEQKYIIDNTLPDDTVKISKVHYNGDCEDDVCDVSGTLEIEDYYTSLIIEDFTVQFTESIYDYDAMYINQDTYDKLFYEEIYQVSILTSSSIGVKSLANSIQRISDGLSLKYKVIYPYDTNASDRYLATAILFMSIGMIGLIIFTLIGSALITYVIFKAIINTKLHDYAIFRTIGANKKAINTFIYIENIYVVIVAYVLFVIVNLSLPKSIRSLEFLMPLQMFNFWSYIILFFLLILMSLLVSRRYCNKIFNKSVQSTLKSDAG
ncbi:ATP-binding cassette domain-containing protein [Candidatus Izemoplasma sp. B36]|uniref:ABC transporter ATP-binding protein/permease n=1 Tax=Candidatus Izemoplasma sp. B36 TaxID=3242468 RepID=UPI0035570574